MNSTSPTYLRIWETNGTPIRWPGKMLLAAMCSPDPKEIEAFYLTMCAEENVPIEISSDYKPSMSRVGVEKNVLRKDLKNRRLAGWVLLEIHQHLSTNAKAPSLREATRTVARKLEDLEPKPRASPLEDTVMRAFRKYRGIAHYLALLEGIPDLVVAAETNNEEFEKAIQISLYFQRLMEEIQDTQSWNLIRVPKEFTQHIEPNFE